MGGGGGGGGGWGFMNLILNLFHYTRRICLHNSNFYDISDLYSV